MELQPSDWIQILIMVTALTAAVAVLKNDIKWLGNRLDQHQRNDDAGFKRMEDQIDDLRDDIRRKY